MKVYRLCGFFVFVALILSLANQVSAQQSASSASVSRSRAIANAPSVITPSNTYNRQPTVINFQVPDQVAVEEFVNYHKHRLPLPKVGRAVALDVRWGNDEVSKNRKEAVLQIGFTTPEVTERTDLRPLNLSLVIDKSGSMAESDKMSRVKDSLHTFISKLRPEDIVSIIVFDTNSEVLFPAATIGDGFAVRRAIDCIEPGGSTNLHGGLMLGYKENLKNFRKDATNRVILLTDGIANVGVVEPGKITAESSEYNGQGIDLSTIGVGLNLNNDLLRALATSGRGLYHFVSDYQDIEKVFVTEVQSLVSSVAKNVEVKVDYDPNLEIERVYGYAPRTAPNGFAIGLDNMNNGLTQVVMTKFRLKNGAALRSYPVRVRLSYFDVKNKKTVEELQTVYLNNSNCGGCNLLADSEVKKNFTIAELAQSLLAMTNSFKKGNSVEAENFLNQSATETRRRFPNLEDKDVNFVLNIVENYRKDLRAYNTARNNGDCGTCN